MIIRNVDHKDLDSALASVNAVFSDNIVFKRGPDRISSTSWSLTLTVKDSRGPGGRRSIPRSYNVKPRRIAAACWHVHGLFMDSLPDRAVIVTSAGVRGRVKVRPGDDWIESAGGGPRGCMCEAWDNPNKIAIPYRSGKLPGVFLPDDYGSFIYIVDDWTEFRRVEATIKAFPESAVAIDGSIVDYGNWPDDVIGFSDEWSVCPNCSAYAFRHSPDSYSWAPCYLEFPDGDQFCPQCWEDDKSLIEDHIAAWLEHSRREGSITLIRQYDPAEYGWTQLDEKYQNGLYGGQNDDPKLIIELFQQQDPPIDVLFTGYTGQFDITFFAWVRDSEVERALFALAKYHGLPFDPATEMSKALRGEHSDYYHVESRMVSADEFISGDWLKDGSK